MNYLTASEIADKWNISSRMVAYYCEKGRIVGAIKKGKTWLVPLLQLMQQTRQMTTGQ